MSIEKPIITAVPGKVRAVLKLHKAGPFKAGNQFHVVARAGQLFKAQRFGRIDNAESFELHQAIVGDKKQLQTTVVGEGDKPGRETGLPMFRFTGIGADFSWPTCMTPEEVRLVVEATADVDEFSCELEGLSVRSLGDAQAHDYDREPLDVTLGT